MMSMAVPGVIGAMIVTSRFGNCSCARAGAQRQAAGKRDRRKLRKGHGVVLPGRTAGLDLSFQ